MTSEQEAATIPSDPPVAETPLWRRIVLKILLVLFALSLALAVPVVILRNQIHDTGRYVRTVAPLAEDPNIQAAVATAVSNRLITQIDRSAVAESLDTRMARLAGPMNSAVDRFVNEAVLKIVQSSEFETIWKDVNRAVHPVVSDLLTGKDSEYVTDNDGEITLDFSGLADTARQRLEASGIPFVQNLPPDRQIDATVTLVDSPRLGQAQSVVSLIGVLAVLLPLIALVSLIVYLVISTKRRRGVINLGLALTVAMAILLILIATGRHFLLNAVDGSTLRLASAAFFDVLSRYIRGAARVLALLGLLITVIAAIMKPGGLFRRDPSAGVGEAGGWQGTMVRRPWLGGAVVWTKAHYGGVIGAGLAIASLWIIATDHISLDWLAAIGIVLALTVLLLRLLPAPQPAPDPATQ